MPASNQQAHPPPAAVECRQSVELFCIEHEPLNRGMAGKLAEARRAPPALKARCLLLAPAEGEAPGEGAFPAENLALPLLHRLGLQDVDAAATGLGEDPVDAADVDVLLPLHHLILGGSP